MLNEKRDILHSFAEGRQLYFDHIETIKEIFAEGIFLDQGWKSLLVAVIMRTPALTGSFEPKGSYLLISQGKRDEKGLVVNFNTLFVVVGEGSLYGSSPEGEKAYSWLSVSRVIVFK